MPLAVVAYLDAESSKLIEAAWTRQANQGISAFILEEGYRPHITLGACASLDLEKFEASLKAFAAKLEPFAVEMPYIGVFPHKNGAVFLGVTATEPLLACHRSFHDMFERHAVGAFEVFGPGRWVPHCSLAYHESRKSDLRALELNLGLRLPLTSTCVNLAVIEFPPWRERAVCALGRT